MSHPKKWGKGDKRGESKLERTEKKKLQIKPVRKSWNEKGMWRKFKNFGSNYKGIFTKYGK